MTLGGGCYCGALRYRTTGRPILKALCLCRACQHVSGGGPNYFMLVPPEGFQYLQGTPNQFTRPDLAQPVTREFCGTCGTHILTRRLDMSALVLKIGTLDDPAMFRGPRIAIYAEDQQPFHHLPDGLPVFQQLPPPSR
ncbi:MAG: GFA family protein [Myxococcota bacterium]